MSWDAIEKNRQRLAREEGAIVKDWGGRLPFAIIYPNSYYVGMSNLGVQALYRLLNGVNSVIGERVFWEKEHTAGLPLLSMETQRPLSDFAVLAFSISYELDYFNVPKIIRAAGMPVLAADRDDRHPILIAGGPCIISNPVPLSPFFDCLCIGEAEVILPPMLEILGDNNTNRDEKLKALAKLPGLFVPRYYSGETIARQRADNLDDFMIASSVLTRDTELGDMYLIEVERGCHWQCHFCLACHAFRPVRSRSLEKILDEAGQGLKYRRKLGLVGADVSDYPRIDELVNKLHDMGAQISVSSLRIKPLSGNVLREITRSGTQSIALAPEAGSQRLRDSIHKGINEADILAAVEQVAAQKIKQVKFYFMVGLPTETDDDIQEIINLTRRCKAILETRLSRCRIILNISPFVPKAGTPFQREAMAPVAVLESRIRLLKTNLISSGIEIKEESPAWSEVQAVLSLGDAKIAAVLADMEKMSLAEWRKAMDNAGLDIDSYVRKRTPDTALPWGFIDTEGKK